MHDRAKSAIAVSGYGLTTGGKNFLEWRMTSSSFAPKVTRKVSTPTFILQHGQATGGSRVSETISAAHTAITLVGTPTKINFVFFFSANEKRDASVRRFCICTATLNTQNASFLLNSNFVTAQVSTMTTMTSEEKASG